MNRLYEKYIKTESLPTLFCPGCGNGIIQYAAIEAFERLDIKEDVACVSGIGCSSWIPCYFKLDVIHTMHGRAIAFAEGLKLFFRGVVAHGELCRIARGQRQRQEDEQGHADQNWYDHQKSLKYISAQIITS